MQIKQYIVAAVAAALAVCASAQQKSLFVGQVSSLTGPAASIGLPLTQAAHAYFRRVNESGGINGYKVVLLDRDDGFKPDRTIQEVKSLLADKPLLALINVVGAPNNAELVTTGLVATNGIPVVGAFTGATSVRALKSPLVFFVRAGVADEARRMVEQVNALGMTRIGLVYANDAFGNDAREQVEAALASRKQKLVAQAPFEPATSDMASAVAALRAGDPQAVLFFGGPAAAKFVLDYRKGGGGAMVIANSSTSSDGLAKNAGELAKGVGLAQAVPSLSRLTIPIVAEYHETLKRYGDPDWAPSPYGLEGFLAAKVLAEGLRRAGAHPTRESLAQALARIGQFNAGGITLDYSNGSHEGLRTVDIGIIGGNGKLMN